MTDARRIGDARPVGFVGLGQIGAPMARRLLAWPAGLVVFDVVAAATGPFADDGAVVADSVAALGAACGVVSVMVRDDEQVRAVVAELAPAMADGGVIAVHSTIRAETAVALAAELEPSGIALLDVPVSGGVVGATDGTLAAIVGGDRDAYERAKPVFSHWASLVVHMGPAGAGTRTKLARNLIHFVSYAAAAESQRLAEAAGLDLGKLGRVVRHSDAVTGGPGAIMVRSSAGPLAADDPLLDIFRHTRALGEKDLALALELAAELDIDLPFTRAALADLAASLGLSDD
jgi:3-hydroxyisobutyrate dehydrogenase-like beta-hydroxyacid dehydrogenase